MEPRLANRARVAPKRRAEAWTPPTRPLVRPAPRSAMFFPLVVLVAVLPGLYALRNYDMNPPGPWWGLRGLVVLEGRAWDQVPAALGMGPEAEANAFRAVAMQPPLYAWLEAAALLFSPDRAPMATVLPSYVAGALAVILVYLHGRLWGGPGLGLTAALLVGFNRDLLHQMQQASPTTLGLAGALLALLAYAKHHHLDGAGMARRRGRRLAALGGLALGISLLSVRGMALFCVPVALLHQIYLGADPAPGGRRGRWWRGHPSLWAGAIALGLGLAIAAPWHASMIAAHGTAAARALWGPADPGSTAWPGLLRGLLDLTPATLPLGLFGAWRAVRLALTSEPDDRHAAGGAFWTLWLAVAAILPVTWPEGPRPALTLFLMVPLNLLAARTMIDLAGRRIPVRSLAWIAPATALAIAWWASSHLREAVSELARGHRPAPATALGLHLGVDLLIVAALTTRALDRWARRRDDRHRLVLGGFLAAVILAIVASGLREVGFRHRETAELLELREMILRRQQARPFTLLAVVGPDHLPGAAEVPSPGGRLRFILRSTLPHLAQLDLARVDDLLQLPECQRLFILVGTEQKLSYAAQSRLNLEAIHPSRTGLLDAFATTLSERPRGLTRATSRGFAEGLGGEEE